jgi:hypothetical protein
MGEGDLRKKEAGPRKRKQPQVHFRGRETNPKTQVQKANLGHPPCWFWSEPRMKANIFGPPATP